MAVIDVTQKSIDTSDNIANDINGFTDSNIEDKTENQVERLARSGLYISPADAIKFLSDQVSDFVSVIIKIMLATKYMTYVDKLF